MKNFVLWFVKISGILPFLIWYRPQKHYESSDRKACGRGEILIANPTMMDFAMMLFVYPFRTIRVLMAEILYSNPFMKWFLPQLKGIRVNRHEPENTDKLHEAIVTLNQGGIVGVFPEGHLNANGKNYGPLLPFSSGAAYLAIRTGAPVRPLYFHVAFGLHRSHIMVGDPIDLQGMFGEDTSPENIGKAMRYLRQKMEKLREETKFRAEFQEKSLLTRFTRWSLRIGMRIAYPFRIHCAGNSGNPKDDVKPCIVASNHICTIEPPLLCMVLPRLKLHILACEALYKYPMLALLLNRLGCIRIDRTLLDIESFHLMQSVLERNESIGVFPEGGISPDGTLRPFKSGTILAAVTSGVDIIPVYIAGQGKLFRRKGRDIWVGERITLSRSLSPEDVQKGTDLLYQRISDLKEKATEAKRNG